MRVQASTLTLQKNLKDMEERNTTDKLAVIKLVTKLRRIMDDQQRCIKKLKYQTNADDSKTQHPFYFFQPISLTPQTQSENTNYA